MLYTIDLIYLKAEFGIDKIIEFTTSPPPPAWLCHRTGRRNPGSRPGGRRCGRAVRRRKSHKKLESRYTIPVRPLGPLYIYCSEPQFTEEYQSNHEKEKFHY